LAVSAGADNARVLEAVRAIRDEFDRLRDEDVSGEELKKVKDMLRGKLALGLESSDEIAEFYGFQEILKRSLRSPEETLRRLNSVTAKDVRRMAKTLLAPEKLRVALIGPSTDTKAIVSAIS
jgi:predicted Zn-dependent peptidase